MVYQEIRQSEDIDILEMCIRIETTRAHLYYDFLRLLCEPPQVGVLWWNLCDEGYRRTAALTFIKREVELEVSKLESLDLGQDRLYHLLRLVERYERRVRRGPTTLDNAFKIAVRLKSSGVDNLVDQILGAVDPIIGEMATRSLRPVRHSWRDLVKAIESCSTDEILRAKVRRITSAD